MVLSTVLPGVLLLGIVIFVHELGHFLAAKARGVRVLKFSLGMGPEMIGFRRGETRYCISWIPLGGFVQMAGDSPNEDGTLPEGGPEEFLSHPWPGRVLIAIAGPLANLVTCYVVMVVMCLNGLTQPDYPNLLGTVPDTSAAFAAGLREGDRLAALDGSPVRTWHDLEVILGRRDRTRPLRFGIERDAAPVAIEVAPQQVRPVLAGLEPPANLPVIGNVVTGMPAYRAGLQAGDRIRAVEGKPINRFDELGPALRGKVDQPVRLTVQRGGRTFELDVTPIDPEGGRDKQTALIGIEAPRGLIWTERFSLPDALSAGLRGTGGLIGSVYGGLWLTVSRPLYYREYVGGPIFIAQMAGESARKGLDHFLYLLAMINVAIMAFNLLPIPLLDGGHITLALLQAVRGRRLSAKAYLNFQKVGLVLVGTLFILILSKDVLRPFQRQRAVEKAPRETTTVAPAPR